MARLVSYKARDENRYSTFANDGSISARTSIGYSEENLSSELNRLNHMRNLIEYRQRKNQKFHNKCCNNILQKLFICCFCCHNTNNKSQTNKTTNSFNKLYCCKKINDNNDDDDDNDIDGKFAQIQYDMSFKELHSRSLSTSGDSGISGMMEPSFNPIFTQNNIQNIDTINKLKKYDNDKIIKIHGKKQKYWNWDDSLRSNSDKFLETLESDDMMMNPTERYGSLKRILGVKKNRRTTKNILKTEEELNSTVAAADACSSSLVGNKNVIGSGSASPIASHGSASSDPWPSQSEEDIDRLVALHQNRNSLSSLGVRSDSMASVYSGAGEGRYGTVTVKGQVEFGMQYNYKQNALEIHVVRCKDLAAVDIKRNRSDPYVKVYLLPDKSKSGKRKTKVKKHTLNPIFDETLRFHMPLSNLENRTLWLTVWHSDMFGRNDFLGEVTINLQGKVFDNPQSQWYLLQERSEPYEDLAVYRGDIIVGLKFIPPESSLNLKQSLSRGSNTNLRKFGSIKSTLSSKNNSSKGQLHVLVKEAKNLSPVKASGSCDAFCKSYLLPDKTRSSKQKTHVVKRTTNPIWNYTFVYEDVSLQELSERALELTVWDHDRLASNEFLGGVRFSLGTGKHYGKTVDWMDATGKELSLWQNMLNRPNFWVEGALVLRSSLESAKNLP